MSVLHGIGHALELAFSMTWKITWALILGFALSAVVQAAVRRSTITRLLGDDRPTTLAIAAGLGAASSSCSYAAVALARSLFRKGANFTGLVPNGHHAMIATGQVTWNYTTFLNIAFLILATVLVVRFVHSGGVPMPKMMGLPVPAHPS